MRPILAAVRWSLTADRQYEARAGMPSTDDITVMGDGKR